MSAIQKNVEASSERYSASFTQGHLALPPAKKYLVLTCMDARIDPARAFGIGLGDAHVIRNVRTPSKFPDSRSTGSLMRSDHDDRQARRPSTPSAPSSLASSCWAPTRSSWSSIPGVGC